MQDNTEQPKQSKYNAAVSQLYRLDTLWQSCHEHSTKGELLKWNVFLDAIWRELSGDSNEKDLKLFYKLDAQTFRFKRNYPKYYRALEFKELFLRKLQNKQGKGSAYVDPEEDDLED